jgi:hypothetical protein
MMELEAQTSVYGAQVGIGWREAGRKRIQSGFGRGVLLWISEGTILIILVVALFWQPTE